MVRYIAGTAALFVVLAVASGFASSLNDSSKTVGANTAAVASCDPDGVTVTNNLTGPNIVSVTVAGVASPCANQTIRVTVNNGQANSSASGTVPPGGGSMTLTLGASIADKDVVQTDLTITG
jgi:hypothetical protein